MGEGDCSWLDEFLCEYVDGTMDPAVRKSFEEYLSTDPVLALQVEHLRQTRTLLCHCRMQAPDGLQARMRRRLAGEMMRTQPPAFHEAATRLSSFALFASAMVVALMMGMFVGATLFTEEQAPVADRNSPVPDVVFQDTPWSGTQPVAMSPLMGQRPRRVPVLVRQPASVLRPLTQPAFQFPAFMDAVHPYSTLLQRTDVAP